MKNFLIFLTTVITLLIIVGCSNNEALTDSKTKNEIQTTEKKGDNLEVFYQMNNMVGRKDEYYSKNILIDSNYYKSNPFNRGDVIYFNVPNDLEKIESIKKQITRVVALEGEKVTIKKGQVYINDMKLDSFYGQLRAGGMNEEEFFSKEIDACKEEVCKDGYREFFSTYVKDLVIPKGSIFVISDNSTRGYDSLTFGPLPVDQVIGRVLGYKKEK
ncbi:signal peptidase I [Paenibacillus herberti]|uniref:Signal peptidase I n=1 Tax=Paenibacillus herberti TaxID=1619309 RepID=A0A229P319_9BACL|nr:signal peptidase I [Paenibacillus herberti]OXM16518.1 signal peptidase I [Paenibacillus herberti]